MKCSRKDKKKDSVVLYLMKTLKKWMDLYTSLRCSDPDHIKITFSSVANVKIHKVKYYLLRFTLINKICLPNNKKMCLYFSLNSGSVSLIQNLWFFIAFFFWHCSLNCLCNGLTFFILFARSKGLH